MSDRWRGGQGRAVRLRLGWRQEDAAGKAGVSQDLVSDVELGRRDVLTLRTIRTVLQALDVDLSVSARWRGGDLDQLVDAGHAALVARVIAVLEAFGWVVRTEVSFAVYGERGSIDVLAWHPRARILLVVEVKTTLNSVEETLRRHDTKVRLAAGVARERFGWSPVAVGRLLVLPADSTSRRRAAGQAGILTREYALRGPDARRWLRDPSVGDPGAGAPGLPAFLPLTLGERGIQRPLRRQRVRVQGRAGADGHPRQPSVSGVDLVDTTLGGRR